MTAKLGIEMDGLKILDTSVKALAGRVGTSGGDDEERERRNHAVNCKGFKDKLKAYSGDLGEKEYRTMYLSTSSVWSRKTKTSSP